MIGSEEKANHHFVVDIGSEMGLFSVRLCVLCGEYFPLLYHAQHRRCMRKALPKSYLCSKSTGALTSCTRKYLASAGYFLATASYIAYATLR